jgi:hypothetical protein
MKMCLKMLGLSRGDFVVGNEIDLWGTLQSVYKNRQGFQAFPKMVTVVKL